MNRKTPEFDQRIADWLEDDPNLAPNQVTATVLAALPSIHQRRRGWFRADGRTFSMPTTMRAVAAIAIVAVVGLAAVTLLKPLGSGGPPPSPTPSPLPAATPGPTQAVVDLGTITLSDTGCTWAGNPGSLEAASAPVIGRVAVVNETDTFANLGIYRLNDGRTWEEAAAWIVVENAALQGGPSHPPQDFATAVGSIDAPERQQYPGTLTLNSGTHGVVCSSNEPPPGLVFAVYLVGPLDVAIRP